MTLLNTRFEFDLSIFRLAAVKKAAYRFSNDFVACITCSENNRVVIVFTPRTLASSRSPMSLESFPNEVLDQDLRELVAEETSTVRDVLLAQAFSGLSVVDPISENADYRDDPYDISSPRPKNSII